MLLLLVMELRDLLPRTMRGVTRLVRAVMLHMWDPMLCRSEMFPRHEMTYMRTMTDTLMHPSQTITS